MGRPRAASAGVHARGCCWSKVHLGGVVCDKGCCWAPVERMASGASMGNQRECQARRTQSARCVVSGTGTGYSATMDWWCRVVWRVASTLLPVEAQEHSRRAGRRGRRRRVVFMVVLDVGNGEVDFGTMRGRVLSGWVWVYSKFSAGASRLHVSVGRFWYREGGG